MNQQKEVITMTMMTFKIEHKYCGFTTLVSGCNVWDAMKKNGKDLHYWKVISIEYTWEC